jgi:hypothetical protein
MNQEKKILINSLAGSVIIGILVFVFLVSYAPDGTPYSVNNYGWNGLHGVSSKYSIQEIGSLDNAPISNNTVLLIIAPSSQFSSTDVSYAKQLVQLGGTIIIADSYGFTNSLMSEMGLGIQIQDKVVIDSVYNWQSQNYPIALVNSVFSKSFPFLVNVTGIALSKPRTLLITSPLAIVLATSSAQSVETNGTSTSGVSGTFPLVAAEKLGNGFAIVIGDSSIFTDSVWTSANNQILIKNLMANSHVYLDTSHWPPNVATSLKSDFASAYSTLSEIPFRYFFSLVFVAVAILLLPMFTEIFSLKERNPEPVITMFNNDILSRVRRDRERYGIQS